MKNTNQTNDATEPTTRSQTMTATEIARNAVKLGCLAAKIAMTDDLPWADALAVAKAGLTDHGPAFARIYGVTITR